MSYSFVIPNGIPETDTIQVTVQADSNHAMTEAPTTNHSASTTFTATLTAPDLIVGNLSVSPQNLESSDAMTISWADENIGDAAVMQSFYDQVEVFDTTTGQTLINTTVGYNETSSGLLNAGSLALQSTTFTLPNGNPGTGTLQVTVTTDSGHSVPEYNDAATGYTNNTTTTTVTSILAPYPVLSVANLSAGEISTGVVTATWEDANASGYTTAASSAFYDQITLTDTTTGQQLGSTNLLYNPAQSGGIPSGGESPLLTTSFQIPHTVSPTDTLSIQVHTDVNGGVFEVNTSNNISSTNVTPASLPELAVSAVSGPATGLPGQVVTVNWTLANKGNAAANGPWQGTIYLATDASGDNPSAIGTFNFTGSLAVNASISRSVQVPLPPFTVGSFFFVVQEDSDSALYQLNTTTSSAVAAQPINLPDALTLSFSSSSVMETGSAITGTITRNSSTTSSLSVNLGSSETSDLTLPASVIIPAGRSSATFSLSAFDDGIAAGSQSATITASATNFSSGSSMLTVVSISNPTLTLSISPTVFSESAGSSAATGTVTRNTLTTNALVVSLLSNNLNKVTVPATVAIPAGQTFVTFPLTAINDDAVDGTTAVNISVSDTGFLSDTIGVSVTDVNVPTLSVALAASAVSQAGRGCDHGDRLDPHCSRRSTGYCLEQQQYFGGDRPGTGNDPSRFDLGDIWGECDQRWFGSREFDRCHHRSGRDERWGHPHPRRGQRDADSPGCERRKLVGQLPRHRDQQGDDNHRDRHAQYSDHRSAHCEPVEQRHHAGHGPRERDHTRGPVFLHIHSDRDQ